MSERSRLAKIIERLGLWIVIIIFSILFLINVRDWYNDIETGYFLKASAMGILQAATMFFLGVVSVYLTRRHFMRVDIDEIIAPLYYEVKEIRKALQLDDFTELGFLLQYETQWSCMEGTSIEIRVRKNVDARIPEFYNSLNLLRNKFYDLSAHFRPQIDELFDNEVSKMNSTSFQIVYKTGYKTENRLSPYRYLIFGLNPIDFMKKKDEVFEISSCKIKFYPGDKELNYGDIESECEKFFVAVEEILGSDPKIVRARAERNKLVDLATKIFNDLEKMV